MRLSLLPPVAGGLEGRLTAHAHPPLAVPPATGPMPSCLGPVLSRVPAFLVFFETKIACHVSPEGV